MRLVRWDLRYLHSLTVSAVHGRSTSLRVSALQTKRKTQLYGTASDEPLGRRSWQSVCVQVCRQVQTRRPDRRQLLPGGMGRLRPETLRAAEWQINRVRLSIDMIAVLISSHCRCFFDSGNIKYASVRCRS